MIQTLNEYLPNYNSVNETIASDTLKSAQQSKGPPPKPSASNAEVEQTMRLLQTLSPQQRDLLKQALAADTNDAWKKGVDYSECNRVSLKAYPNANKSSMSDATTKKGLAGMGGKELSELLSKSSHLSLLRRLLSYSTSELMKGHCVALPKWFPIILSSHCCFIQNKM